jgi:hypothetical protein
MEGTKLSSEKMVHLSHEIIKALRKVPDIVFVEPDNDVRKRLLTVLRDELIRDLQVDHKIRRKISRQRRDIPEGSPEWDILFRKYYEEELSGRHRI